MLSYVVVKVVFVSFIWSWVFELVVGGIMVNVVLLGLMEMVLFWVNNFVGSESEVCYFFGVLMGCFGRLEEVVGVIEFLLLDDVGFIMG